VIKKACICTCRQGECFWCRVVWNGGRLPGLYLWDMGDSVLSCSWPTVTEDRDS